MYLLALLSTLLRPLVHMFYQSMRSEHNQLTLRAQRLILSPLNAMNIALDVLTLTLQS